MRRYARTTGIFQVPENSPFLPVATVIYGLFSFSENERPKEPGVVAHPADKLLPCTVGVRSYQETVAV